MGFNETLIFYHLIGLGVALAVFLADSERRPAWSRGFRLASAVVFWPLYLPILLASTRTGTVPRGGGDAGGRDEMAEAIARAESELETALAGLDGWAEGVLARELPRIRELSRAWKAQADRIREMDRLLAGCEPDPGDPGAASSGADRHAGIKNCERSTRSERARRANLERIQQVRRRAHDDLLGTLAWVRELVSMIHLARFTGAPATRAEELVSQIAAAVEGISSVTWEDAGNAPAEFLDVPTHSRA